MKILAIHNSYQFLGGKFNRRQLRLAREAGFRAARTVELLSTARPRRLDGLFLIPTTVQAFSHHPFAYAKNAVKRFSIVPLLWPAKSLFSRNWSRWRKTFSSASLTVVASFTFGATPGRLRKQTNGSNWRIFWRLPDRASKARDALQTDNSAPEGRRELEWCCAN